MSKNEAKEGHNGTNWSQIGLLERVPDRLLTGNGMRAGGIGVVLGVLVWEDVLESSAKPVADIVDGTGQEFIFVDPEPRQGFDRHM